MKPSSLFTLFGLACIFLAIATNNTDLSHTGLFGLVFGVLYEIKERLP